MVLFKRKAIIPYKSNIPPRTTDDADIWVIKATGEGFHTYDSYLNRLDYYNKKKFTCEITGHTNLTFFDALASETAGSVAVNNTFPELLKEPVLRKVQFSTVGRIDDMVNTLYDTFVADFFPGERVEVVVEDGGEKFAGVIREKASFPEIRYPDGTVKRKALARYFVTLDGTPREEALVDGSNVNRERRTFTKQVLRSFLRNSVKREPWDGAPWLVNGDLAQQYHIDTTVPARLSYDHRRAEKKAYAALKKGKPDEQSIEYFADQGDLQTILPAMKGQKGKLSSHVLSKVEAAFARIARGPGGSNLPASFDEYPMLQPLVKRPEIVVPIIPQPKYPMEDLDIVPKRDGVTRPRLKFLTEDMKKYQDDSESAADELKITATEALLEIWDTLNVHSEFYVLDQFTFDDFVDAMTFASNEVPCELFAEIHCAILKTLIDGEGNVQADIPDFSDDDDEGSDVEDGEDTTAHEDEDSETVDKGDEIQVKPPSEKSHASDASNDDPEVAHRAEDMLGEYDWVDRIRDRDFARGGWQTIVVGLLHHMSKHPRYRAMCLEALEYLAPEDAAATQATALYQYNTLEVNLRIATLQLIVGLTISSRGLKEYMLKCEAQMTQERLARQAYQKQRKTLVLELHELDQQRRTLVPATGDENGHPKENGIGDGADGVASGEDEELPDAPSEDPEEDEQTQKGRSSRRSGALKRKREEKEAQKRKEEERKKKEEQKRKEEQALIEAAGSKKQAAEYKKVLKQLEAKKEQIRDLEVQVAAHDEALRQQNRQRTKPLGRDRFWNRYWWFERQGMPFGASEDGSTSGGDFANGRIWVQGPMDYEREGFIDYEGEDLDQYKDEMGMTPRERKELEEGETRLEGHLDWGYYDKEDDLDGLLGWLDDRGNRETTLRKELLTWRDKIVENMEKRNNHLADLEAKKLASEGPVKGIATRKKTFVDHTATKHPCLAWKNYTALHKLGHLHCDGVPPKRNAKTTAARSKTVVVAERPSTRQGTRNRER